MAASQEQKVDYLLKKIGYTASKTGIAEDSSLSGTKKAPFGEAIPSPLVIPSTNIWSDSTLIPATPPTSNTSYVGIYTAGTSGLRMTVDNTVSGNRTFIARSVWGDISSNNLGDWIDTQFGSDYVIKVYKGDPASGGTQLSAAGSGSNDTWFFDYSSGILNFNGTVTPTGITTDNIYLVGYRYIGAKGAQPAAGIATFSSLNVSGVSTFASNVDINASVDISTNLNVVGLSTFASNVDINAGLDVSGLTELDTLNVSVATTTAKLYIGTNTVGITTILDEDNLVSNSDTALATQQSIKKYVDDLVTAQDLDIQGDTGGALSIDLDSETLTIAGTPNEITTVGSGNSITVGLPDNVTVTKSLTAKQVTADYYGELHKNNFVEVIVTTATKTANHRYTGTGYALGYVFDGDEAPYIQFIPGKTYRFNQSNGSNTNHALRFYLDANKTQSYTEGVTFNGVPGNSGAYTQIVVTKTTPAVLYYQSNADDLMGNQIQTVGSFVYLSHNVGLGTTNPTQQLQVGETFTVTLNSDVGIGTTNPTANLDVVGHTELDTLNVSTASTITSLNVSGLTTTSTLYVSSGSTFRDDVTVLLDDSSAIGIGTTSFTPLSEYIVDVRGNVNVGGTLIVNGSDVQNLITSEQGNFVSVATTNLNVTGIATFASTSTVDIKAGFAATGGDVSIGTAGTGFYYDDSVAKVGIGTTLPQYKLDVLGDVHVSGYTSTAYLTVGTGSSEYTFPDYDGVYGSVLRTDGDGNLDWFTSTTIRQTTEFNAGAGQTEFNVNYAPGLIDVFVNGIKLANSDYVGTSGTSIVLNVATSLNDTVQVVGFNTDSVSSRPILDYWKGDDVGNIYNITDNVGIGVSTPTQLLDVAGDVRIRGGLYDSTNDSGLSQEVPVADGSGGWVWSAVPTAGVSVGAGNIKNIQFHNAAGILGGSNEFNFDYSTNRVGIGTTVPITKLDVRGDTYISGISSLGTVRVSSGIITASSGIVTYYGDGSGLSSLNATNLSSGTIDPARLSGTYNIDITGSIAGSETDSIGVGTVTASYDVIVGGGNTGVFANSNGNLKITGITTTSTLYIGTNTVGITTILDEDDLVSDSDTALATQQSIKKYVDDLVTAQDLDISDGTITSAVDIDTQTLTIQGTTNEVDVSLSSQTYTVGLPNDVTVTNIVTANAGFANTMSYSNTITGIGETTDAVTLYDDLDATVYRTVEYSVQATQGSNFHFTKLLAVSDGSTAYLTEYGTVFNNSSIASYDVDVAGGFIRIRATAGSATTATYVVNFTANKIY